MRVFGIQHGLGCRGVQIACGKTSQTAVAEGGVLHLIQAGEVYALDGKEAFQLIQHIVKDFFSVVSKL